jgi:phosphatidate phosphatase
VQAFVMSLLLTQVFKVMVGRLRPNFLARCQPAVPNDATIPLQNVTQAMLWQNQYPCTDPLGMAEEGRLAFPSGVRLPQGLAASSRVWVVVWVCCACALQPMCALPPPPC